MSKKLKTYRVVYITGVAIKSAVYPDVLEAFYCESASKVEAVILCVKSNCVYSIESVERLKDHE